MTNSIKLCTFQNILEIAEPLNNRLLERFNKVREDKGEPLLTERECRHIKVSNTIPIAKMLYKFADSTDELIDADFEFGIDCIMGDIRFKRNGENYYIKTSTIFAEGYVQRLHTRFICNKTNAPRKDNIAKSRFTKLEKLFTYVNDVESTDEFRSINSQESLIKEYQKRLEMYENMSDRELYVFDDLSGLQITDYKDYLTNEYVTITMSDYVLVKCMYEYLGMDLDEAKQIIKAIDDKFELQKSETSNLSLCVKYLNESNIKKAVYINQIIDKMFNKKDVDKQRKKRIKFYTKSIEKCREVIEQKWVTIDSNIAEYRKITTN